MRQFEVFLYTVIKRKSVAMRYNVKQKSVRYCNFDTMNKNYSFYKCYSKKSVTLKHNILTK